MLQIPWCLFDHCISFQGYRNNLPQSGQLETRKIYSLTVRVTRCQKSRCQPCWVLWGFKGRNCPRPLFQLPVVAHNPRHSLAMAASLQILPVFRWHCSHFLFPFLSIFPPHFLQCHSPMTIHEGDGGSEAPKGFLPGSPTAHPSLRSTRTCSGGFSAASSTGSTDHKGSGRGQHKARRETWVQALPQKSDELMSSLLTSSWQYSSQKQSTWFSAFHGDKSTERPGPAVGRRWPAQELLRFSLSVEEQSLDYQSWFCVLGIWAEIG